MVSKQPNARILVISTLLLASTCSQYGSHSTATERLKIKADYFYNHNMYSTALPLYDKLIMLDSANGQLWFRRSFCYGEVHKTNNQQSIDGYKAAIFYHYEPAASYFQMALCYLGKFDDSTAAVYLEKSVKLDPTNRDAVILLAGAQQRLEMNKKSEAPQLIPIEKVPKRSR